MLEESEKSVSLYFTEGSSDKEYHIQLSSESSGGWRVNFRYGRRGSSMNSGTKTEYPVAFGVANSLYEDILKKQLKKGYTVDAAGTPYQGTKESGRVSGLTLQLLNSIDEAQAMSLISDDLWFMQQKHDGVRMATQRDENEVRGINRKGLITPLPIPVVEDLMRLNHEWLIDGEMVGSTYFIFDILSLNGDDLKQKSFADRAKIMADVASTFSGSNSIVFSYIAKTTESKKSLYQSMINSEQEGVVFKLASAPYTQGRPNSGGTQLKRKFIEQASILVIEKNQDRRSVLMGLYDERGDLVPVGNCTIPPNHKIPSAGEIADVSYLYAFKGGSIFQPTWVGVRDDISSEDCRMDQLKFKSQDANTTSSIGLATPACPSSRLLMR